MLQFLANVLKRRAPQIAERLLSETPAKKQKLNAIFKPLVWIDCEMTGLDVQKDNIIEICCIITDGHLNIIDEKGYESTVYVSKQVLNLMNPWCVNQHGKSGLTAKVLANPQQTLEKVQVELLEYIQLYIPEARTSLMAGNSIHMDKFFMMREFPKVIEHLHYRLVDVSSIMEVGYRHNPDLMRRYPKKQGNHTARSDIIESIQQLKWYRDNYLRGPEQDRILEQMTKVRNEETVTQAAVVTEEVTAAEVSKEEPKKESEESKKESEEAKKESGEGADEATGEPEVVIVGDSVVFTTESKSN